MSQGRRGLPCLQGEDWALQQGIQIVPIAVMTVRGEAAAPMADASSTVKGVAKLSVEPATPSNPIAVGDNDPRNSDARAPMAHGASHGWGGADAPLILGGYFAGTFTGKFGTSTTSGGTVSMGTSSDIVLCRVTTNPNPSEIKLSKPITVGPGVVVIIKDAAGTAATKPITVIPTNGVPAGETIDGAATATISTNYGSMRLVSDGVSAWLTF